MTPRRLDWRAVEPKLRRIDGLLKTLVGLGPVDERRLREDEVHSLAVERILTLVVDLAFAVNGHVGAARSRPRFPLAVRDFGEYVRQAAGWVHKHATE